MIIASPFSGEFSESDEPQEIFLDEDASPTTFSKSVELTVESLFVS